MIELTLKKCLILLFCIAFIVSPVSAITEPEKGILVEDQNKACGIVSSEKLLKENEIEYDEEELEQCICENEKCNASINRIHDCLKQNNLETYVYKVNETQIQPGDVIHIEIKGRGHYSVYEENKTDLTGFIGYIITTHELQDQKTVPIEIQREICGQCPPCAALTACALHPVCSLALRSILQNVAISTGWCLTHQKICKKRINAAWVKVEKGNKKLGKELKQKHKVLVHH